MSVWLAVAIAGVGTYLLRLSFIAILGRTGVPSWLQRALRFVAPAVFGTLIAPAVFVVDGGFEVIANPKVYAALAAGVVAWRFRNVAATIAAGMVVLWIVQAL